MGYPGDPGGAGRPSRDEAESRGIESRRNGDSPPRDLFHVVGVGASAGGLEALERLFDGMPRDCGMAFVVIQHLSPDFKSLMDELLGRRTKLAIHRVEDGMLVEPNSIYLIPPKKEMIISGGRLLLTDKDPSNGLNLPIDIFFRSLAQDFGNRSIGVILSGTGSDGSRGIRDIHDAGGLVVVQSEETAKFDGMPRTAIDTGVVDFILPPEAIPDTLLRSTRHPSSADEPQPEGPPAGASESDLNGVFQLLKREYGIDFSYYKPNTVQRRVERRLLLKNASGLGEYLEQLAEDSAELNALYKDLLIGVTKFFRDPAAYERLEQQVLPEILGRLQPDSELRMWVAGCATGEEAYSLAMLVHEYLDRADKALDVKIFATDVHRSSLETASAGVYGEESLSELSPERIKRYFTKKPEGYQISQELRQLIVFAPHNIVKDAPFTKLDFVSCRNLLIYLQPVAQKKALSLFHFAMKTGGVLFLGPSESPGDLAEEFDTLDHHWKIFRKRRDVRLPADLRLPLSSGVTNLRPRPHQAPAAEPVLGDSQLLRAYDTLLDEFVPPSLLINERHELVHCFAGAGKYLTLRDGRPSSDVLAMVAEDLKIPLAGALQRAAKHEGGVVYKDLRVRTAAGEERIKLSVRPLAGDGSRPGHLLATLEGVEGAAPAEDAEELELDDASRERMDSLESELRYTKENLQATVEELETSNEELQAANEELVASNEELQSTNEELHSVNEELYTVNAEYQRKIGELTELTADMDNLFQVIDVGIIFLDRHLRIRKFTDKIAHTFSLLPHDVGRPLDSFTHSILHEGLHDDIQRVIETRSPLEREVQDRQGNWYLLRILPYVSNEKVDGAVMTLVDVSVLKEAEKNLLLMSKVFMDGADPIIIEDLSGKIIDLNEQAEKAYGWQRDELLGQSVECLWTEEGREQSRRLRERCLNAEHVRNIETERRDKEGRLHPVELTLSMLTDERDQPVAIASIARNIRARKAAQQERERYAADLEAANEDLRKHMDVRRRAEQQAKDAVRKRDQFLAMLSHELRNPLGAVVTASTVLANKDVDPESIARAAQVIRRQTEQMARLLDDLLDVSRVTQGKIEMRKEVVDVTRLVADGVQAVQPAIEARRHELIVEVGEEPLYVVGDPSRILQVQENLLSNAAKYTSPGGKIWCDVRREGDVAAIRVRDTGEGIPEHMLEAIFDMFVQSNSTLDRSDGGMGVGLTLVKKLVQMHGGAITAHSEGPGKGSEFTVRLPLTNKRPAKKPEPLPEAGIAADSDRRVLIVEDNDDSREMLRTLLELENFQVQVARDGAAGLEAIISDSPDIALVDIGLPGLDGYEVARKVRAQFGSDKVYLVALTGYGRKEDREAVLAAGFDEHLVKPLDPNSLSRVLRKPR